MADDPQCVCATCGPPWRNELPVPTKTSSPLQRISYYSWMALCPRCGSKRCDGASNHNNPCNKP